MWKRLEWLIALFILMFYAGLLTPSQIPEGGSDPLMDMVSIVLQSIVIPLTMLLVSANWPRMMMGIRACRLPMTLSALLVLSTAWSVDRPVTLRRGLILLLTALFGVYLGGCLTRSRQLRIYTVLSILTIIGCFVIAIVLPSYGISADKHAGAWKGLFQHKNALARQMVFALALFTGAAGLRKRAARWGVILAAFLLLGLSRSGTGLLGFAALLFGYLLLAMMRMKPRRTLPLWLALLPMAVVTLGGTLLFRGFLAGLIGKDATFTGRTDIWAIAMHGISLRPIEGWGYAAFWKESWLRPLFHGDAATHAHNGFIDIALDVGLSGLLLFMMALFSYAALIAKRVFDRGTPLSRFEVFAFLYLVIFLAMNVSESNLLRYHTFLWLPFVSMYTALALGPESGADLPEQKLALREEQLVYASG